LLRLADSFLPEIIRTVFLQVRNQWKPFLTVTQQCSSTVGILILETAKKLLQRTLEIWRGGWEQWKEIYKRTY